jgi:hypothetical protein
MSVRTAEGREGEGRGGRCVRADVLVSARTHGRVRADAPCFTPGNFKKDPIVRPSHRRPCGHRPIVRPSVRKRPRDNHAPKVGY